MVIAGQFSSCPHRQLDCAPLPFCEGFAGGPRLLPGPANEGERGIADFSERPWCRAGTYPAGVLAESDVAHIMQAVLDLPMVAGELQKTGGFQLVHGQAGDGVNDLARAVCLHFAEALDPANCSKARPFFIEAGRELRAHGNPARLDPAVALLHRSGAFKIVRITPRRGCSRNGGNHARRGECRRTPSRVRIAVPAGCL